MEASPEQSIYALIGEEGFARLARAFYERVPADPLLAPMYVEDDVIGAEQRLRDFLVGRFGGPQRYIEERGHPRLRIRHGPFPIDQAARDAWMAHMSLALEDAELPEAVAAFLRRFFGEVSTFLMNRQST